jgi:hypothetical protein
MKKIALFLSIILVSCFSETEQQKVDNSIMDRMYIKAKQASFPYHETFNADSYYTSMINDSIVFCQQNYSYKNDYGVKKIGKTYGFFNSRNGEDVTEYIDIYVSDNEISRVSNLIK